MNQFNTSTPKEQQPNHATHPNNPDIANPLHSQAEQIFTNRRQLLPRQDDPGYQAWLQTQYQAPPPAFGQYFDAALHQTQAPAPAYGQRLNSAQPYGHPSYANQFVQGGAPIDNNDMVDAPFPTDSQQGGTSFLSGLNGDEANHKEKDGRKRGGKKSDSKKKDSKKRDGKKRDGRKKGSKAGSDGHPTQETPIKDFRFEGTALEGISGFMNSFETVDDANVFLTRRVKHKAQVEGDDFAEVEASQKEWVRYILDAMRTLPTDDPDGYGSIFDTIAKKGFGDQYFEARAYEVVGRTIRIHKHGSELHKSQLHRGAIEKGMKASERLRDLADMFFHHKNVVKDILDGWKFDIIIDQPADRLKRAEQSVKGNKGKKANQDALKSQITQLRAGQGIISNTSDASPSASIKTGSGRKGKMSKKPARGRGKKRLEVESEEKSEEEEVEEEESGEEEAGEEETEEEEYGDKQVRDMEAIGVVASKGFGGGPTPTPQGPIATVRNSKSFSKVTGTGGATNQATSHAGRKRGRSSYGDERAGTPGEPSQGGRVLRPRK